MKIRLDVTNIAFMSGRADAGLDAIIAAVREMGPGDRADFVQAIEDVCAEFKLPVVKAGA